MAKLTIEDLKKIKATTLKQTCLRYGNANIEISVHMSDCGIAAGARDVMQALMQELAAADREDIRVFAAECIGKCSSEPNVTVAVAGQAPVVYQQMTPDKMRQVFKRHVLLGEVQTDLALAKA